jgi:heme/copper-type cytochrome/quinol oxidase subunit 4
MKWTVVLQVVFRLVPFEVTIFLFILFWRCGWSVSALALVSKRFRLELLLLSVDDHKEETEMMAISCFYMFLSVFVLGLLWFAYRYDESGTFKPDWTNKFG